MGLDDGVSAAVGVSEAAAVGVADSDAKAVGDTSAVGVAVEVAIGVEAGAAGVCDLTSTRTSLPEPRSGSLGDEVSKRRAQVESRQTRRPLLLDGKFIALADVRFLGLNRRRHDQLRIRDIIHGRQIR